MKKIVLFFFVLVLNSLYAQNTWYVSPTGSSSANGSINNPWDLQTALNHPISVLKGDVILLRGGIYNGRYSSYLIGDALSPITVKSFPGEWAILDGNDTGSVSATAVLSVYKNNVIFRDFEITWRGQFSRLSTESNFRTCNGIGHFSGKDCKFINLIIHDNPGSAVGSWKSTGATEFYGCMMYNNGYFGPNRGHGVGMYVQNKTADNRWIENNIIFNNYYKGLHFISANYNANSEYVKNFVVLRNTIFGSYSPSGGQKDNIDIGTFDQNQINVVKNITLKENILYQNVNFASVDTISEGQNLTIGLSKFAPVENVILDGNIIIGRSRSLRLQFVKSIVCKNNIVFTKYIDVNNDNIVNKYIDSNWNFYNNTYYSRYKKSFRIKANPVYEITLNSWQTIFGIDTNSTRQSHQQFNLPSVLEITQNKYQNNRYKVVLFDIQGKNVDVDFSGFNISVGANYTIKDVENYDTIAVNGQLAASNIVNFPMNLTQYKLPTGNNKAQKTFSNFGVFIIEFTVPYIGQKEDLLFGNISVYPNPVKDYLYIRGVPEYVNVSEVTLINPLGVPINIPVIYNKVNVSGLNGGMYLLTFYINQKRFAKKILVIK